MLWYLDCYTHKWTSVVKDVLEDEVVLDKTFFYPESGGQPSDFGTITFDFQLFNVLSSRKADGKVFHKVDKIGLKVGDVVECEVDWTRRHILMRHHTACHILSRIVLNETGALTTGKQIYIDRARIDFSLKDFDKNKIKGYEEFANKAIQQNYDVKWFVASREDADKIPDLVRLKHKPLLEGMKEVRIVDIVGCDAQACGGTHVKNTREIGKLRITKAENKGKENRRIEFVLE
ncbi:MAG: alanyl-tRNA editing protein [Candidatus Aenigmarchaeota archaeon]|nr:alanyl-tRNA editing protein [Candidatus Aenigmarchaeota archaeon]